MRDAFPFRSGCPFLHIDQGLLEAIIIGWSWPLLRGSLQILLEGSAVDLREHCEIGLIAFQPEWR